LRRKKTGFLTVVAYRAHSNSPGLSGGKEVADRRGNLAGVCLKCKVAGVEKAHDGVRDVARECFGARRQEEWVVPAQAARKRGLWVRK
jgi:hypothetical protein